MSMLIKGARVVSENYDINDSLDVYIEDGIIREIGENLKYKAKENVKAYDMLLMPGLIDMSCKICEAGYENKDNIITVSKSAIAGGFTSLTTSPKTQPVIDNKTVIEYISSLVSSLTKINFYPYGSLTKNCEGKKIAEVGEMIDMGVLALSDGGNAILDLKLLKNIILYCKMFDVPVLVSSIDDYLADEGVVNEGYMSTKLGVKGSPIEAENIMVSNYIVMASHHKSKLHISHITAGSTVNLLRSAKAKDIYLTAGTCPHYFSLTQDAVDNYDTFGKVYPPLRTKADNEEIIKGLWDGTIDVIASGHTPAAIDKKMTVFDKAAFGISGLETSLMVSFTKLVKENGFTPLQLAKLMSENPAKILRLSTKGAIKVGMDADLILVDDKNEYMIDSSDFISNAKYSPYDGQKLYGKVIRTIANGKQL